MIVPDNVTNIGSYAFEDTAWYDNQPEGLVYAGKVAYRMKGVCPAAVTIREGTLGIAGSEFHSCNTLTDVTIPDSVVCIGEDAFRNCTGLTSIVIPDSVGSIGRFVFYDCISLFDVTISNSLDSVSMGAFCECDNLTSVTFPNSVTDIGGAAFSNCDNLSEINIPDSVTIVDSGAFADCPSLTEVTIPKSVRSINPLAFGYYYDQEVWLHKKTDGFTIYGYEGSEGERYADENGFTFVSLGRAGATVSGSITSLLTDDEATVKLTGNDNDFSATATGIADYAIENVPAGEYTMTVGKKYHVTREYTVTVTDEDIDLDVKLSLLGDVDGDNDITVIDATWIQRSLANLWVTDSMDMAAADVDGDGEVSIIDATYNQRKLAKVEIPYPIYDSK